MSEFDLSQVDQGRDGDDLFPESTVPGELTQREKAKKLLVLSGKDTDPVEAATQGFNEEIDQDISALMQARTATATDEFEQLMQERLYGASDESTGVPEQLVEMEQKVAEPDAVERAVVQTLDRSADERAITHETARLYAAAKVAELVDKQDLGDNAADILGMFVPFNLTADLADIEGGQFGTEWSDAVDVEGLILDYQALSPEEKIKVFPGLAEAILDATGTTIAGVEVSDENVLKAAQILTQFFDPQGEANIAVERGIDVGLGFVDVGGVGAIAKAPKLYKGLIGTATNALKSKTNTAKVAANLGNKGKAAEITISSAVNPSVGRAHGVSQQTAGANALALNRSTFDLSQAPEINDVISASLNEFQRASDELTRRIIDDQHLLRAGALNDFEKGQFIQSWEARLNKNVSDVFNDEVHLMNLKIKDVDEVGFTATYDIRHIDAPSPQKIAGLRKRRLNLETKLEKASRAERPALQEQLDEVVEQLDAAKRRKDQRFEEQVKFTIEDNGNFNYTVDKSSEAARALGSPAFWSYTKKGGDFNDSFKTAGVSTDLEAAFAQNIEQMVTEAWQPISGVFQKGSRKRVEDVLHAGDVFMNENGSRGYVYNVNELIAGVDTGKGIVRLTDPAEIEAYYRVRAVADNFWRLENHAAKRRLELNGYQHSLKLGDGDYAAIRTLETSANAKQSVRNRSTSTGSAAYDEASGEIVDITDELIDAEYAKDRVLARTSDSKAVRTVDGETEYVDYILVDRSRRAPLPDQVVHFKRGYVPKVNQGVEYLVKEFIPIAKRGARDAGLQKTLRFFASKRDAEQWALSQAQKAVDEGRYDTIEQATRHIEAVADRELTPMQRVHEPIGASGGLFTGARSSDDILTGMNGAYTERVGAYEAMARNSRHLGSLIARNEARIGDEARWLNTVDEKLPGVNQGFLGTKLPADKTGRTLEAMRQQIKAWNGVPELDETAFQGMVQNLHDWALNGARKLPGLSNKDSIPSILYFKHKDLAASVKTAVMHLVLGALSPAQLVVQASAMSVAVTRYPRFAPQMIAYGFRMGMADLVKDTTSLKALTKHVKDVDDATPLFDELYDAWNRSGLRESVRSNADLTVAENYGFMTERAMQRMGDASLLFYRQGELMNRRAAFITSYLSKRQSLGRKLTGDELLDVRKDANLTMLELNQANRAWWQGGPQTGTLRQMFGVMTQFQQVAAKSIELLIKGTERGGFSTRQKLGIMAGQFSLFGAAGIPIGNAIINEFAQNTGAEMDQDTINAWNQGLIGIMTQNVFGSDIDISNRTAAFGQLSSFAKDLLFDDVPLIEKFAGVGFDVGNRMLDTFRKVQPLMMGAYRDRELSQVDVQIALQALAEIPSSGRNIMKAWLMHNSHVIRDRHGNAITRDNYNLATEIGVALGFRPTIESETRVLQMTNKDYNDLVTSIADRYVWLANNYIDALDTGDKDKQDEAARRLSATMAFIASSTADNPIIMNRVYERVQEKITNPETLRERSLQRYIESTLPEELYDGALIERRKFMSQLGSDRAIVSPLARELERQEQREGEE